MKILGIETSCDETAAAVVENGSKILSNKIATSISLHAATGGIIPEVASRQQLKFILPVIEEALEEAKTNIDELDAIAVTYGPGLIGPLLIGTETAKTLSYAFNKPLIPINHLLGHVYANWLEQKKEIEFPALALIVSGGHTDLIVIKEHRKFVWLGGTRDDAAGEAFDKIGRLLGFAYPAGPQFEEEAKSGNANKFDLPKPMVGSKDFDFSFSGLKTAAAREIQKTKLDKQTISDFCASVQQTIVNILVRKTTQAATRYEVKSVLLGGGVAANQKLRDELQTKIEKLNIELFVPEKKLCTDNGAMIASAAYFVGHQTDWQNVTAAPQLYFD